MTIAIEEVAGLREDGTNSQVEDDEMGELVSRLDVVVAAGATQMGLGHLEEPSTMGRS